MTQPMRARPLLAVAAAALLLAAVAAAQDAPPGPRQPPRSPQGAGAVPQSGPWTHRVASATSPDGLHWTRDDGFRLEHASVPCAVVDPGADGDRILLYFVDADRGGAATDDARDTPPPRDPPDGRGGFGPHGGPGPRGAPDPRMSVESTGRAVSTDGLHFEKRPFAIDGMPTRKALDPCVVREGPGAFRFDEEAPAIHSAVSADGVAYAYEPGARFAVDGRVVIDCAVVLHAGVFHLFAPDNGAAGRPQGRRDDGPRDGAPRDGDDRPQGPPPPPPQDDVSRPGVGYHATSRDGLTFVRQDGVRLDGPRRWLGCAVSDGRTITFYGTGGGLFAATSADGATWTVSDARLPVEGADPGVVRLADGSLVVVATGPPRRPAPPDDRRR